MNIVGNILSKQPEEILYHYTSQQGLIGIASSKNIWATKIHYLNGVAEFAYAIKIARISLGGYKNKFPEENDLWKEIDDELESIENINIFVCSFSEKGDLLSQWRSYCREANGFSIGFKYSQLYSSAERQGFKLLPCIYDENDQENVINQILAELYRNFQTERGKLQNGISTTKIFTHKFIKKFLQFGPILKHPSFSEEKEWRLISPPTSIKHSQVSFREGKYMIIPYFEFELVDNQEKMFVELIVGPTPHKDLAINSACNLLSAKGINYEITSSKITYRGW